MDVAGIRIRIQRQFGDESGVQVTNADAFRWISDSQREIIMSNPGLMEVVSTLDIVASQQDYALPADMMVLRRIGYKASTDDAYLPLKPLSLIEFDTYIGTWDPTNPVRYQDRPIVYTVWEGEIKLWPIPFESVPVGLKFYYSKKPTEVTADLDPLTLPDQYHNAIVKLCLRYAYEMDEDWQAAQQSQEAASQQIGMMRHREKISETNTYPTIIEVPDDWGY